MKRKAPSNDQKKKVPKAKKSRKSDPSSSLLTKGYLLFDTTDSKKNDGKQNCSVELTALTENGDILDYHGTTSSQRGHAEIDALCKFLREIGWDPNEYPNYILEIECTSKPCCVYCSAVMGLLSIHPTEGTYKSRRRMGVSYALPPDLRKFISRYLDVDIKKVERELQKGWS